jgi:hypothetical protein
MELKDRILELRQVSAAELRDNPANWRTHPRAQRALLGDMLRKVGLVQPLLLNLRSVATGWPDTEAPTLVDGHLRKALISTADKDATIPVAVVDLTPDEEALVLSTLDPIGAMAGQNDAAFAELLEGIEADSENLAAFVAKQQKSLSLDGPEVSATGRKGRLFAFSVEEDDAREVDAAFEIARAATDKGTDSAVFVELCRRARAAFGD